MTDLRKELARKSWHLLLLFYLVIYLKCGQRDFLPWMVVWMALIAVVETLRLRSPAVQRALMTPFSAIMREREVAGYSGVLYTTAGVLATVLAYGSRPRLVSGAVLSLALADSAAALVGKVWGRTRFRVLGQSRSVEGAIAGFFVSYACGLAVGLGWAPSLAGAAVVTAVDCVPPPPDDNVWIPIGFAAAAGAALGARPEWPW